MLSKTTYKSISQSKQSFEKEIYASFEIVGRSTSEKESKDEHEENREGEDGTVDAGS